MDQLYKRRKQLRIELQSKRCLDKDHSYERYKADAAWLDATMVAEGYPVIRRTSWPDGSA